MGWHPCLRWLAGCTDLLSDAHEQPRKRRRGVGAPPLLLPAGRGVLQEQEQGGGPIAAVGAAAAAAAVSRMGETEALPRLVVVVVEEAGEGVRTPL